MFSKLTEPILEKAIARLKAGDSREKIRADLIVFLDSLLNTAVLEEARRHNAALPDPGLEGYTPGPLDFNPGDKIVFSVKDGSWRAEEAPVEFLDRERHLLPQPGSKVIHSKNGVITSELLPDTWEDVKEWVEKRRRQHETQEQKNHEARG